jgi:hypothetical protein
VDVLLALAGAVLLIVGWCRCAGSSGRCARTARRDRPLRAGLVGVLLALGYLSVRYPFRFDLTPNGVFSLSEPTVTMLKRLTRPVHIVFFADPMMRETVELYELMAAQNRLVSVEVYDPMVNPAQAACTASTSRAPR